MSATFTYKINAIRTATVGDNTGVVKHVEWTLVGTQAHIQYVLDKEVSKAALTTAPMPWVPVVETPDPAPTAPIV